MKSAKSIADEKKFFFKATDASGDEIWEGKILNIGEIVIKSSVSELWKLDVMLNNVSYLMGSMQHYFDRQKCN